MTKIISAKNLYKSYGREPAIKDLSLEIESGEFFGFLGPNGAGKTTTIRMLTGIIQPDQGEILIDNKANDRTEVAKIIGVMPESRGFYDWMTAEEYLMFFAKLYNVPKSEQRVKELLGQVSLTPRKASKIGAYSRGMKQRLGLARALVNSPKILFLDEPTLGLDPQGQEDIQKLLKNLNSQGVTVFYSSHLLNEVSNLCTRIGIINHGSLVAQGTIAELQQQTKLQGNNLTEIFLALTKN